MITRNECGVFVLLVHLTFQGFSYGVKLELKANVGKCLVIGQSLILTCSISDWTETIDPDLQLLQIVKGRQVMNHSIIDNRTIQAVVLDTRTFDSGLYVCRYEKKKHFLSFNVTEPDPLPKDIECIGNSAATHVSCTWSSRDRCATWRAFYSKNGGNETKCILPVHTPARGCAKHTIDSNKDIKRRCRFRPPGDDLFRCNLSITFLSNFSVRLERSTPNGIDTRRYSKRFDDTLVKLNIEQKVHIQSSSTTMILDWTFPYSPLYYQRSIRCLASCGNNKNDLIFPGNDSSTDVRRVLFKDLQPFTEYNITLTCQINGSLHWSDPVEGTYQTEEDIPRVGPHTTADSYTLAGCVSETAGFCLTIYTKQVDKLNAHGNIRGYEVEIHGMEKPKTTQRFNFENTPTTLEIKLPMDGFNPPFNVSIWSKTSKGLSNKSTDFFINLNEDLTLEEVIVEKDEDNYLITAEALETPDSLVFICHWCYGVKNDKTVTCKEGYEHRSSTKPEFLIQKTELGALDDDAEDTNKYRWYFGMSVSMLEETSGIRWEDCNFQLTKDVRSLPRPEKPELSDGKRNQIIVRVQPFCPPDNKNNLRPINYTIVCTNIDDEFDERTETFAARYHNDRFEINALKPDSTYNVKYTIGYRQSVSPFSEPVTKYIAAQPQTILFVGLAVVAILLAFLGILIVYKSVKWFYKSEPIEGVEINSSNWDKSDIDVTSYTDGVCAKSQEKVGHDVGTGCNKHGSLNGAYTNSMVEPDSKSVEKAKHFYSEVLNPQYEIIGTISSESDIGVDSSRSYRSENIAVADDEICSNELLSLCDMLTFDNEQNADEISTCRHPTMDSDGTRKATVTKTKPAANSTSSICNHSLTQSSGHSENEVDVENIQGSPPFTSYLLTDGCSQNLPEVMLNEHLTAPILGDASVNDTADEDDSSQQRTGVCTGVKLHYLPCIEQQFHGQPKTRMEHSELSKGNKSLLKGYKQMPIARISPSSKRNIDHEMTTTIGIIDEASDSENEQHIPKVPLTPFDTFDAEHLNTILKLDDTSWEIPSQIFVLEEVST